MTKHRQDRSRKQRDLRQRRGERAFLFEKDLDRCLGSVDRDDWEFAVSMCGGDGVWSHGSGGAPRADDGGGGVPLPDRVPRAEYNAAQVVHGAGDEGNSSGRELYREVVRVASRKLSETGQQSPSPRPTFPVTGL